MKVTILGSGGFGYPLVFCNCSNCNKARILGGKNIRKRASILINDEMLVDLTPDTTVAMGMYKKDMANVKYLLQTHTHLDHFDINHFTTLDCKYATNRVDNLNLICSALAFKDIYQKANQYDKMDLLNAEYLRKINLIIHKVNHGENLVIGNYEIKAIHCTHHEQIGAQNYLIKSKGKISDGYHTFNELYNHRAVLFGLICSLLPKDKTWKSLKHHDGTMFDGMFVVGINTEYGQITYHYDIEPYYNTIFAGVRELPNAPEYDGHTPDDVVERLSQLIQKVNE